MENGNLKQYLRGKPLGQATHFARKELCGLAVRCRCSKMRSQSRVSRVSR